MRTPNSLAVPYSVAALLALGAAFMPWTGHDDFLSPVMNATHLVDAWHSHLVGGRSLLIPNWTPLLVLVSLTLWAWGGAPRSSMVILAVLYGFAHLLVAGVVFYDSRRDGFGNVPGAISRAGVVGGGIVVTFVAYLIVASATATYLLAQRQRHREGNPNASQ